MKDLINKKVLITTENWFYGRDGRAYRAVHGTLKAIHEAGKTLGFIPNRAHANWFVQVGEMTIMGCQVMYLEACESVNTGDVTDWLTDEGGTKGVKTFERPSTIYITS